MFLGWNDRAHSGACVLEQASTASDMQFRVRTTASLRNGGYKAIRADKLRNDTGGGTGTELVDSAGGEADDGTDGVDAPAAGGCWSGTLKENVPALACVESVFNEVWYQCSPTDGKWYRGVSGGSGPFGACASQHPLECVRADAALAQPLWASRRLRAAEGALGSARRRR
jgi:hypothetical protein